MIILGYFVISTECKINNIKEVFEYCLLFKIVLFVCGVFSTVASQQEIPGSIPGSDDLGLSVWS